MNYNERAEGSFIRYVILHYTDMPTGQEALARLRDPSSGASAHYLIEEDGQIFRLVDEKYRAWHAGESFWQGQRDLNSLSIGIELVNLGHTHGYRPFPDAQIQALLALLHDLQQRYALAPEAFLAHSDIAPLRKCDPGELFPWPELARHGFGLWPEAVEPVSESENIPSLLARIGYDTTTPEAIKASEKAFLRHYHPERLEAGFDALSHARLAALARMATL
ncbi:MAG: N-acetylmuramoyl-L-alanine amidase [Alphaproteobacteria bacterium]|nr:N-acetylmuramoyl-L-alanine amidase [Alphaproteobacteria bacterium]